MHVARVFFVCYFIGLFIALVFNYTWLFVVLLIIAAVIFFGWFSDENQKKIKDEISTTITTRIAEGRTAGTTPPVGVMKQIGHIVLYLLVGAGALFLGYNSLSIFNYSVKVFHEHHPEVVEEPAEEVTTFPGKSSWPNSEPQNKPQDTPSEEEDDA